jgi:hypothetical protein
VRLGLGALDMRIRVPLDPDHRKDNDRGGLIRPVTTKAHDAPFVREFDYVAHQPLSFAAGTGASCSDAR